MTIKALMCGLLATTALGAGAVTVVASNNVKKFEPTNATAPTNTRRLWIINNNGNSSDTNWWNIMYAHIWTNDPNTFVEYKVTEKVLADYYWGLWYVDVTFADAATSLNVIIRAGDDNGPYSWGNKNQSFTQSLGALGTADTIWLNNGVSWNSGENRNDRNTSLGTTNGFDGPQLGSILSHYHTCSANNTDGYNSYPQMETNFFLKTDHSAFSTLVYGQSKYTCQDYVDGMYTRYNANN